MPEIDKNKQDNLLSRLVKSVNWKGLSLLGLGKVVTDFFSTAEKPVGMRFEITPKSLKAYNNYGTLIFLISTDINAVNPIAPTIVVGSGIFIDLIRSISTALALSSKTGKAVLQVTDAGNGKLIFIGDAASGNLQLDFSVAAGLVLNISGTTIALTSTTADFSGVNLKLNNNAQAIGIKLVTGYVTMKQLDGSTINVATVT